MHQVRRDRQQGPPFAARLEDEMQVPVLEIPDATVDETGGSAARSAREIIALDESGLETAQRRIARDAGAGDAASDDQHIERRRTEVAEAPKWQRRRHGSNFR